jgi:hypothetical protein
LFTVIQAIVTNLPVPDWSSLIVLPSVLIGTILLGTEALGVYMWRALDDVLRRPIHLERNRITSGDRNRRRDMDLK